MAAAIHAIKAKEARQHHKVERSEERRAEKNRREAMELREAPNPNPNPNPNPKPKPNPNPNPDRRR